MPWIDAKYYASTQVMDEARHVEVFAKYLDTKLSGHYPINAHLRMLLDDIIDDSRWDMTYLGMQIMVEGLALAAFGFIHQMTTEPLLKQLLRYVMSDEARHVAFGVLSLKEYYDELSDAEMRERQEFAFEAAVRMRDRFLQQEVWERMGLEPQGGPAAACIDAPQRQLFQQMLFSKIVPNCKKLGLLDAGDGWLRQQFAELGVIQFEDWADTGEEYEAFALAEGEVDQPDRLTGAGRGADRGAVPRPRPHWGRLRSVRVMADGSARPHRHGHAVRPTTASLDLDAAADLARWLVDHGNDGLVVAGTTGESPTLTDDERIELFRRSRDAVDVPLIAGTTTNDTAHTVDLTEAAPTPAWTPSWPSCRTTTSRRSRASTPTSVPSPRPPPPGRCSTTSRSAPAASSPPRRSCGSPTTCPTSSASRTPPAIRPRRRGSSPSTPERFEVYSGDDAADPAAARRRRRRRRRRVHPLERRPAAAR